MIDDDEVSSAFLIPKGFAAEVIANRRTSMTVLRNPNASIGSQVADALAEAYTGQINASRLSVLTAIRTQGGNVAPAKIAELARAAASERIPVQLADGAIGRRKITGANYFGPSMAIFFLFFTTGFASRSLLAEREQGTMPRILAAPIRRSSVIAGKALTGFVVGVSSLAVMFTVFGLFLHVDWGDPVGLIVLSAVLVLAVMGLTAVVQTFAKTQEQADSYSSMVAVSLALLGGSFFPLFQMPMAIQRISLITPNGWAIRGFTDLAYDGAKLGDIGANILVILAFALVTGTIAVRRARTLSAR
jgi:ABC-2 type transport system permease protein